MVTRRGFLQGAIAFALFAATDGIAAALPLPPAAPGFGADGDDSRHGGRSHPPRRRLHRHRRARPYLSRRQPAVRHGAAEPGYLQRGWDACSGYHQSNGSIMGFSHTHLSGTGIGDMLDVLVMPATGEVKIVPGSLDDPDAGYRSRYDHADEAATPGYYSVLLKDYGIRAELTATQRAGLHRYSFPAGQQRPPGGRPVPRHAGQPGRRRPGSATRADGGRRSHADRRPPRARVGQRPLHLLRDEAVAAVRARPAVFGRCTAGRPRRAIASGSKLKARAALSRRARCAAAGQGRHLRGQRGECAAQSRCGDSRLGLRPACARLPLAAWERELARVRIQTASARDRRDLLHRDVPRAAGALAVQRRRRPLPRHGPARSTSCRRAAHNYSTYSLWDTYRALHPLLTLIQPERVPDLVNGLVRMASGKPRRPAGLAAARRGDRLHDRLALGGGPGRSAGQGLHRHRLRRRLADLPQARHAGRLPRPG